MKKYEFLFGFLKIKKNLIFSISKAGLRVRLALVPNQKKISLYFTSKKATYSNKKKTSYIQPYFRPYLFLKIIRRFCQSPLKITIFHDSN